MHQGGSEGSANCDDVGSVNRGASMAVGDIAWVSAKGDHITRLHVVNSSGECVWELAECDYVADGCRVWCWS